MASQVESPKTVSMADKVSSLRAKRAEVELGGGKDRIEKQHYSGKLTARERVAKLTDRDSFEEIGMFARHRATYFGMADKELPADGVVTGCATVDGRLVHLASQDFTVAGGAAGETHSNKVAEMMSMSLKTGSPFIFINDSGGARVQEASTVWPATPAFSTTTSCSRVRCLRSLLFADRAREAPPTALLSRTLSSRLSRAVCSSQGRRLSSRSPAKW